MEFALPGQSPRISRQHDDRVETAPGCQGSAATDVRNPPTARADAFDRVAIETACTAPWSRAVKGQPVRDFALRPVERAAQRPQAPHRTRQLNLLCALPSGAHAGEIL